MNTRAWNGLLTAALLAGGCVAQVGDAVGDEAAGGRSEALGTVSPALDRLDQRALPLDDTYAPPGDGTGVTVYVIAGGIRATHAEFGGRVQPGHSVVPNDSDSTAVTDCEGTGTRLASLVGGGFYGVAERVQLVPVRALDCATSSASAPHIVDALNWVRTHRRGPSVVLLALRGGRPTPQLQTALTRLSDAGVVVVSGAGLEGADECTSESRLPSREALVVSGLGADDLLAASSNFGKCVDFYAPSRSLPSAGHRTDRHATNTTGNIAAAALVAGAAALTLADEPTLTPHGVWLSLLERATKAPVGPIAYVGLDAPAGGTPRSARIDGSVNRNAFERHRALPVRPGSLVKAYLTTVQGDADLYLRFGSAPTRTRYDCRPFEQNQDVEECILVVPHDQSQLHIGVAAYASPSTYRLEVEWTEP